jgi:hypothetical protein
MPTSKEKKEYKKKALIYFLKELEKYALIPKLAEGSC